jgi:hypothetical protein
MLMLGLFVPHYARVVCGGTEMYHKGKVVSVEVGSYLPTSTPVFVIDNDLSVGKSLESLIHHVGWQPRSLCPLWVMASWHSNAWAKVEPTLQLPTATLKAQRAFLHDFCINVEAVGELGLS